MFFVFTIACARKFRLSFLAEFLAMIFDDSAVLGGDELCRILPREIKVAARVFADFSGKVGVIHAFAHGVRKRAEVVVDMNGIHAVLRSVGSVRAFYEKTCRSESRGFDFYKSEGVLNGREKEHIRARVNPSENFVAYVTRHNRFVFQSELFYFQFEIFDVITRTADYETESAAAFFRLCQGFERKLNAFRAHDTADRTEHEFVFAERESLVRGFFQGIDIVGLQKIRTERNYADFARVFVVAAEKPFRRQRPSLL